MHWAHVLSPLDSLLNTVDYKNADEENYSFDSVTDALKLIALNEDMENHEGTEIEEEYASFSEDDNALDDDMNPQWKKTSSLKVIIIPVLPGWRF